MHTKLGLRKKLTFQTCVALNLYFVAHSVGASVDYFELSPQQLLETKIISVSKRVESIAKAPAAIYVVTSEDIIRSGITNIPDALRMVPGLDVAQSDSNSWAVSIRGFNSTLANKLLVLIDGRTVYNPVYGGVLWEAQELMLEDIDRIEVVRGPGGTLWGANAVNGVINIITKHTRDTQGGLVSAIYGSNERSLNARYGGTFGIDGSYRVYTKGFNRDSSPKPGGGRAYDQWDGVRAGIRVDWGDQFTLLGDLYSNDTQQLRPHYSLSPPYAPVMQQAIKYQGADIVGRWVSLLGDGAQLSLQTYIDWARRDEPFNFIDNRVTYDIEAQYNFAPLNRHEIIVGAGFRLLDENEQGDNNVSFSPAKPVRSLYNIFVQDKIALVPDRWFLTIGSKLEHNSFAGAENQPNARLEWLINERQTLWAAASRAVRTPTPIEKNLTSTLATAENVRVAFVPNNQFDSEQLTAYELGYRNQITHTLSADLAGFYNDYSRLETISIESPVAVDDGVNAPYLLIPVKFSNQMEGKSHGLELALNWTISANSKVAINYTYLQMSLVAVDPEQEGAEQLYPEKQLGIKYYLDLSERWAVNTSVFYVDKLPAGSIDAYTRLDINLDGRIMKNLHFNLIGKNLLDKTHREFGTINDINAAEVERSIIGKLTWTF